MLAKLPQLFQQGQQYAQQQELLNARKAALSKFDGSNFTDLAKSLFAAGDMEGGLQAANLAAKPTGRFTATPYGGALNTETGEITMPGGPGGSPVNPNYFPTKNPDEAKAGNFYKNGALADQELASVGDVPNKEAGSWSSLASNLEDVPYGVGAIAHSIESPSRQKFQTAARHFINAINRRESGAVVNRTEWQDAYQRFLPVYGDKPETLAAKATARRQALAGIAGEAGPMFDPSKATQQTQTQEANAAPANPSEREIGVSYKLPNGQVGVWRGQGWELSGAAQ